MSNTPVEYNSPEYFEYVYKKHYKGIFNVVNKLTGDRFITEDIIQDVFLKIWQKADSLSISTSFKSYLYKAAINQALTYLKSEKKNFVDSTEAAEQIDRQHHYSSADRQIEDSEIKMQIAGAMKQLPPACRAVFVLCRYENASYKEAAEILGISENTVDNHMNKAMKILKKALLSGMAFIPVAITALL